MLIFYLISYGLLYQLKTQKQQNDYKRMAIVFYITFTI